MSWNPPSLVVNVSDKQYLPLAQQLANKLELPLTQTESMPDTSSLGHSTPTLSSTTKSKSATNRVENAWQLQVNATHLRIVRPDGLAMTVDFINSKAHRRSREHNILQQPLTRALGLKTFQKRHGYAPTVIDGTAGLGQDAWLIACLGCKVTLVEQSTVLSSMLEFAVQKALTHDAYRSTAELLSVENANTSDYLATRTGSDADIVFLDPMYPARRKQALVKKEMQLLHELLGPDANNQNLLQSAVNHARYRVVVKRPKGAEPLFGTDTWPGQLTSLSSPNTRFDIYHIGH